MSGTDKDNSTARVETVAVAERLYRTWCLVRVHPHGEARVLRVEDRPLTIGRADPGVAVDFPLDDTRASRRHAEVQLDGDVLSIRDLESTNGTHVNGVRIARAVLAGGDVVRIGDCVFVVCRGRPLADWHDLGLLGQSPELGQLRETIRRVAPSHLSVLVQGHTGTGKELIAQAIHSLSQRKGPLVPVNCAALAANLVESSLFGHRKGAFTGATSDYPGAFRTAHQGTLFLDEVGDLPLETQPKLLRALESGEVTPVGTSLPIRVDVRVIAATHVDLDQAVAQQRFREDLFGRLVGIRILTRPLRERREDILLLLHKLLADVGSTAQPTALAAEALLLHPWPRNIRELRQLAHRLTVLHPGARVIDVEHLGEEYATQVAATTAEPSAAEVMIAGPPSRSELLALLQQCDGNVSELARRTGRSRKQVYRWLEAAGVARGQQD